MIRLVIILHLGAGRRRGGYGGEVLLRRPWDQTPRVGAKGPSGDYPPSSAQNKNGRQLLRWRPCFGSHTTGIRQIGSAQFWSLAEGLR